MGLRKPTSELTQILSGNLRYLRSQQKFSQEELAEKCGIHRTYVGSVERGERNVTLSSLELFASALNVTVPQLLTKNLGSHDNSN